MERRWIWGTAGAIVGVGIVSLGVFAYEAGKRHYSAALSYLRQHQWEKAKTEFVEAKTHGVLFFRDGMNVYQTAVNAYGDEEWKRANDAYRNGRFKEMEQAITQIPKDAEASSEIGSLLKKDPLKVQVSDFVPAPIHVTSTLTFMMAPDTPAIAVAGQKSSSGEDVGEFYLILWDKKASTYKAATFSEVPWANMSVMAAPIFGDGRNALIVQAADMGSGGFDDVTVYGLDPSSGQLKKYLDTGPQWMGNAMIMKNELIVESGSNKTAYTWDGTQFEGKPVYVQPAIGANDVVIHYSLNPDGTATVDKTSVTLHVGQKLVLIRDDHNTDQNDRILFDYTGSLDASDSDTFVGKAPGSSKITIIPNGGYDWSKAQYIYVNVVP
jgi:hypothetical protein